MAIKTMICVTASIPLLVLLAYAPEGRGQQHTATLNIERIYQEAVEPAQREIFSLKIRILQLEARVAELEAAEGKAK